MAMENCHRTANGNGRAENGHGIMGHSPYKPCIKVSSFHWLDLRVFYVRVSKCEIDDSTPEYLTLNHVPLNQDTLLEVNGVRTSIYSDGITTLLRRDRLYKKSEEVTFVSTDSIRLTGSVKFEVFSKDVLMLSGILELSDHNGFIGQSKNHGQRWSMSCESDTVAGIGFLKGRHYLSLESTSPTIEVYVAGCFSGNPIVLTKTVQLSFRKKQTRKGMLNSIPEYETTESPKDVPSGLALQDFNYPNYKQENKHCYNFYLGADYLEGEDGELSWFNAWSEGGCWNWPQHLSWDRNRSGLAGSNLSRNHQKLQKAANLIHPVLSSPLLLCLSNPKSSILLLHNPKCC